MTMCDTNWDVEKYRDTSETEEQWELRKSFMTKWKSDFPEDRLVCLAKLYINIEFLGCRYPVKVQNLVERLSSEISQSYQEKKKNRLSRFFVSASSAAEDRARGVKRKSGADTAAPFKKIAFVAAEACQLDNAGSTCTGSINTYTNNLKDSTTSFEATLSKPNLSQKTLQNMTASEATLDYHYGMLQTDYGQLVLIARAWCSDSDNLRATANEFKLRLDIVEEPGKCQVLLSNKLIASSSGFSKAEAKTEACRIAWQELSSKCITLIHKKCYSSSEEALVKGADLNGSQNNGNVTLKAADSQFGTPVDSSIAMKMMKVMGWSGGALGANSDGITQPIMPNTQQVHRAGLGSSEAALLDSKCSRAFHRIARGLLQRFASNENSSITDLIFSTDFSKKERAMLHVAARKAGLTSRSYGKDNDRFLVVRKPSNPFLVVEEVIRNGGSTDKYQVIIPDALLSRRPSQGF